MRTIVLVSLDDGLAHRLQRALPDDARLMRHRAREIAPQSMAYADQLVVLDCRELDRASLLAILIPTIDAADPSCRWVALVKYVGATEIDVFATLGDRAIAIILEDSDSSVELIVALFNDMSGTAAAAIALGSLLRLMPKPAHATIRAVLESGLTSSSVKEIAARDCVDRGTANRELRYLTGFTTDWLVDLAKASYAVVLLRSSTLSFTTIARMLRFGGRRPLNALLRRMFELTAGEIRDEHADLTPDIWLAEHVSVSVRARKQREGSQ